MHVQNEPLFKNLVDSIGKDCSGAGPDALVSD